MLEVKYWMGALHSFLHLCYHNWPALLDSLGGLTCWSLELKVLTFILLKEERDPHLLAWSQCTLSRAADSSPLQLLV